MTVEDALARARTLSTRGRRWEPVTVTLTVYELLQILLAFPEEARPKEVLDEVVGTIEKYWAGHGYRWEP